MLEKLRELSKMVIRTLARQKNNKTIDELKKQVDIVNQELSDLLSMRDALIPENNKLRRENDGILNDNSELNQKKDEINMEISSLRSERKNIIEEISEKTNSVQQKKKEKKKISDEIKKLLDEYINLYDNYMSADKKASNLNTQIERSQKKLDEITKLQCDSSQKIKLQEARIQELMDTIDEKKKASDIQRTKAEEALGKIKLYARRLQDYYNETGIKLNILKEFE